MVGFFQRPALPVIPIDVLSRFHVAEPKDTRFASSARLLQSIWREGQGYPPGSFVDPTTGEVRILGSLITDDIGRTGANFLSPDIARFVRRDVAYREIGAFVDERRLWNNLLSSHPLTYNLFAPLAADLKLGSEVFRLILPDFVSEILEIAFEHSPGRGDENFTGDHTAFDLIVVVKTVRGQLGFVSIEMKYSESMFSAARATSTRLDELSTKSGLFGDPAAPALRIAPIQQLWREHLLSWTTLTNIPDFEAGRFVVIHPALNEDVGAAVASYAGHLSLPREFAVGFQRIYLEDCFRALATAGSLGAADQLMKRYTDFSPIAEFIGDWQPHR